jgi:hypothetical protein
MDGRPAHARESELEFHSIPAAPVQYGRITALIWMSASGLTDRLLSRKDAWFERDVTQCDAKTRRPGVHGD